MRSTIATLIFDGGRSVALPRVRALADQLGTAIANVQVHEEARRLSVTDPLTGQLLDYGRTKYRPPKPLADHIRAQAIAPDIVLCSSARRTRETLDRIRGKR